ncbi:pentatricopeptide repeat-containing protein At2g33680-like [Zingiber officinale]|uniref:pentatricopeptide repeat-containing protein At2g33680-like n=1 Tax=Zingiber officinale TaxID=94328 RepID=UPI001C4AD27E|nr:pentatricopeptide repeat-containing protein At2g33680-like [Zingiber officinale]
MKTTRGKGSRHLVTEETRKAKPKAGTSLSRAAVTSLSRAAQSAKACPVSDATHRDPRCLSAIIFGLALDGRPLEALRLFKWFQTSALDPDEFTLSNALSLSANLSALDQGRQIQALVFKKNLPMDVAATNSLINLYFKCGSIADAEKVFDGMLLRDVYTWNNRNKTSSKTLPRFQKLYSRRQLLSTSSCSPRFIARHACCAQVSYSFGHMMFCSILRNTIPSNSQKKSY